MAALRPFRGLRYADAAGPLASLLAPPSETLDGAMRDSFAVRHPHNAVALASPEGHGDDRSKFVRYARAAARLAEWRREGILVVEAAPALYRLTQQIGDRATRTTLFAVAALDDALRLVEATDSRTREDRLRLLEATRAAFEPALAFYEDPMGELLAAVRAAPASSEVVGGLDAVHGRLEAIDDPAAIASLAEAFRGKSLLVADGGEVVEAARAFSGATGAFVALASLDEPAYARLPVHRVVRRAPAREALVARLATRFAVEEHHNRNLAVLMDREAGPLFGLATEGGLGYLLRPLAPIEGPAAVWFWREVLVGLLGLSESEPALAFTDPIQACRAVDEGAAAAFLLPAPGHDDLRGGVLLPHRSAVTFPAIPTGLVFWSMGDDV